MGGAVVVHVANQQLLTRVIGVCVLDVVEGTALDSLQHMSSILAARPSRFTSIQSAIEWSVSSNTSKSLQSR